MAMAAVTLGCNGDQTKVSLERVGCPPLDPEPHQHLRHFPWSCISHTWKILTFGGSRVCLKAVPPQNWARLSSYQTPSLSPSGSGGRQRP